jgi:hypothetical protein
MKSRINPEKPKKTSRASQSQHPVRKNSHSMEDLLVRNLIKTNSQLLKSIDSTSIVLF